MKRYVILRKPCDIESPSTLRNIRSYINEGCKTFNILLQMEFVTSDEGVKTITDKFQVIKNKIAFALDKGFV